MEGPLNTQHAMKRHSSVIRCSGCPNCPWWSQTLPGQRGSAWLHPRVTAVTGGHGKRPCGRQETGPRFPLGSSVTMGPWASQLLGLKRNTFICRSPGPFLSQPQPVRDSSPARLCINANRPANRPTAARVVFLLSASFPAGQINVQQRLLYPDHPRSTPVSF